MSQLIELRNLTPVISTISAGKTSLLNAIYNIKFLEVSNRIGTKFVNIIRYNPKVGKVPIFYHLFVKKNSRRGDYQFFMDINSIVEGSEKIAKKNAEINAKLKEKNVPFEDIFYMTEVGEVALIKDMEYLEKYDLVDIPGLSEYLPPEDKEFSQNNLKETPKALNNVQKYVISSIKRIESQENLNLSNTGKSQEFSYLTGIFSIIKKKVNNGIILFDATNLGREENFDIIRKFHKVIEKPIENFLILLNKIDERKNIEEDMENLQTKIVEFDPAGSFFNYTKNTLLPCSTYSLRNEINMDKHFYYLMCYYFYYYKLKIKKEDETFLDFLIDILSNLNYRNSYNKNEIVEYIEKFLKYPNLSDIIEEIKRSIKKVENLCLIHNNLKIGLINGDKFNESDIRAMFAKLKEDDNESSDSDEDNFLKKQRNENINISDLKPEVIIIIFYIFFEEKTKIPPISMENQKIIDYFTIQNMERLLYRGVNHIQFNSTINYLESNLKKLKAFYEGYKTKYSPKNSNRIYSIRNQEISKDINIISQKLEKFKYYYLPIVGLNNAGKSTIINGLIGYDLLPTGQDITTKKGILIKYWDKDYPEINKVKFNHISGKTFFTHESFLGKGVECVKTILKNVNENFTEKGSNFFYEVYTRIKFLEDNQFAQKLKDKICFIDLPGYGTKYEFEKKDIHFKLIKCCELVIYVFDILKKENNKIILSDIIGNLKENFKDKGSRTDAALQHRFLFINNRSIKDEKSNELKKTNKKCENEIYELKLKAKKEITEIFGKTFTNPNVCILNAFCYYCHLKNVNKFKNIEDYLELEKIKYTKQKEDLYKGERGAKDFQKTFRKYLEKILEEEYEKAKVISIISEEGPKEEKKEFQNENYEEIVKKYFGKNDDPKRFEKCVSLLSKIDQIKYLYNSSFYLRNSYYERFSKDLKIFISFGETTKNKSLLEDLDSILIRLNMIFFQPFKGKKPEEIELQNNKPIMGEIASDFDKKIKDLLNDLSNDITLKKENNIPNSLEECLVHLKQILNEQKKKINQNENQENKGKELSLYDVPKNVAQHVVFEINWIFSNEWRDLKDQFKLAFENETNELRQTFKKVADNYSRTVDIYYNTIRSIFNDTLDLFKKCSKGEGFEELKNNLEGINYKTFTKYLKNSLDKFNDKNLESVLDDIIIEILQGAEECTDYKNSYNIFYYILDKVSNSNYLYKIIDYMYDNSTKKFSQFIKDVEDFSEEYLSNLIHNLNLLKENYLSIFESLILVEKKTINEEKIEREEKEKKYQEELKKYEEEEAEWMKTCNDYKKIRENMDKIKDNLKENIEENKINEKEKRNNIQKECYIEDKNENEIILNQNDPYISEEQVNNLSTSTRNDKNSTAPIETKKYNPNQNIQPIVFVNTGNIRIRNIAQNKNVQLKNDNYSKNLQYNYVGQNANVQQGNTTYSTNQQPRYVTHNQPKNPLNANYSNKQQPIYIRGRYRRQPEYANKIDYKNYGNDTQQYEENNNYDA